MVLQEVEKRAKIEVWETLPSQKKKQHLAQKGKKQLPSVFTVWSVFFLGRLLSLAFFSFRKQKSFHLPSKRVFNTQCSQDFGRGTFFSETMSKHAWASMLFKTGTLRQRTSFPGIQPNWLVRMCEPKLLVFCLFPKGFLRRKDCERKSFQASFDSNGNTS